MSTYMTRRLFPTHTKPATPPAPSRQNTIIPVPAERLEQRASATVHRLVTATTNRNGTGLMMAKLVP